MNRYKTPESVKKRIDIMLRNGEVVLDHDEMYTCYIDSKPLTEEEIKNNWNKRAMYIVWGDGSDSMCQDNKYTLDYILEMNRQGCEVFFDE